MNCCIIANKCQ